MMLGDPSVQPSVWGRGRGRVEGFPSSVAFNSRQTVFIFFSMVVERSGSGSFVPFFPLLPFPLFSCLCPRVFLSIVLLLPSLSFSFPVSAARKDYVILTTANNRVTGAAEPAPI